MNGLTYLWGKIVSYFNSILGTEEMGTTATTVKGAIAEHEQDISDLGDKYIVRVTTTKTSSISSLNAFTGSSWRGLTITPPSGYHLFANVNCRLNGQVGVMVTFDGAEGSTVFSTNPSLYIYNGSNSSKTISNCTVYVQTIFEKD